MTNSQTLNENDLAIANLRQEICEKVLSGSEWIKWPNEFLGGDSPEQRLAAGDYESVRQLVHSILYVGIT